MIRNVLKWPADPKDFGLNLLLGQADERNRSTDISEVKRGPSFAPPRPLALNTLKKRQRSHNYNDEDGEDELVLSGEEDFVDDDSLVGFEDDEEVEGALTKKGISPLVPMDHSPDLLKTLTPLLTSCDDLSQSIISRNAAKHLGKLLDECSKAWLVLGGAEGRLVAGDFEFVLAVAEARVPELSHLVERVRARYNEAINCLP